MRDQLLSKKNWVILVVCIAAWAGIRRVQVSLLIRQLKQEAPQQAPEGKTPRKPVDLGRWMAKKERAALRLGAWRARRAMPALIELLKDPDPDLRAHAAFALGQMGRWEGVAPLVALLQEDNPGTYLCRRVAAASLWKLTGRTIGMDGKAWNDWLNQGEKGAS